MLEIYWLLIPVAGLILASNCKDSRATYLVKYAAGRLILYSISKFTKNTTIITFTNVSTVASSFVMRQYLSDIGVIIPYNG